MSCKRCASAESADSEGGEKSAEPAVAMPATGIDPDWRERIELAKRAYEDGKKLREGKPIMFGFRQPGALDAPAVTPGSRPLRRP